MLRLNTFGGLTLRQGSAPLTGAPTQRRRLALLALLATSGERGMSREKLLAFLWPEGEPDKARHALNQILSAQRRHFKEAALFEGRKTLRLNPAQIESDVRLFEEAIAAGELERAVALYAGPFLDGFFLADAPEFERWADDHRSRFARRCGSALVALAQRAEQAGDRPGVVEWRHRAAELAPFDAEVALRLSEALVDAGNAAGALRGLRGYQERIKKELGVEGDPEIERRLRSLEMTLR
jgi:DNA-binding SARP family transcriptional activator